MLNREFKGFIQHLPIISDQRLAEEMMVSCMILDDSSVIRKVARRIIEDHGCRVVDAADGHEALQICRLNMPDVIVIDWIMPGMDGLEFIIEFKRLFGEHCSDTSLVYCTHKMDVPAMAKAKRAGATHFFMKPFDKQSLTKKLSEIGVNSIDKAA